jgi:hypothetical protein
VTTHTAEDAHEKVLDYAGASLARDTIDKRVIHDARTGTATVTNGGNGSTNGLIDTQSAVGGWPELRSTEAPVDTDGDGMPDVWETANGLNPNNPADAQLKTVDGNYPNVEVYLNNLVADITENQNEEGPATSALPSPKKENLLKVYFNPSTKELNIVHTSKIERVQVYSITGVLVYAENSNQPNLQLSLPSLHKGIYLVRVQDEKKKVYAEKVLNY